MIEAHTRMSLDPYISPILSFKPNQLSQINLLLHSPVNTKNNPYITMKSFFSFRAILAIILTLAAVSFAGSVLEQRNYLNINDVVGRVNALSDVVSSSGNTLTTGAVTTGPISITLLGQVVTTLQTILTTLTATVASLVGGTTGALTDDQITALTTAVQNFSTALQALLATVTTATSGTGTGAGYATLLAALQTVVAAIQVQVNLLLSTLAGFGATATLIATEEANLAAALQAVVDAL